MYQQKLIGHTWGKHTQRIVQGLRGPGTLELRVALKNSDVPVIVTTSSPRVNEIVNHSPVNICEYLWYDDKRGPVRWQINGISELNEVGL
jgi:hypothetical protein